MKVLVIGGTRLLGLAVVRHLLATENSVTVLSRHPEACPAAAECIAAERMAGLTELKGHEFDVILDFIAYDESAPGQVFKYIERGVYVLISSIWVVRLEANGHGVQEISTVNTSIAKSLPPITYSYMVGKMRAEASVVKRYEETRAATSLRLPIFWGQREHTGRLGFYLQRLTDSSPIICVDGGNNLAQIVWCDDVARAIVAWLPHAHTQPIWEALPDAGTKVRDVIKLIASGVGEKPRLVDISSKRLRQELPEYLDAEPLWRESPVAITKNNLFQFTGIKPTPQSQWLSELAAQTEVIDQASSLRLSEISFLENLKHDQ